MTTRIEKLRADYAQERGQPFVHFYCPVLFKDEDTRLCKAHIINKAFSSSRVCTVQRHDVDNFYGQNFEADFLDIQRFKDLTPIKILEDKGIAQRFSAKIYHQDQPVDYFHTKEKIPVRFTPVKIDGVELSVPIALKMDHTEVLATEGKDWVTEFSRDLRVSMMPSLIKSAYLILFHLLGYRYALSGAGHFIGRAILGNFFLQNKEKPKPKVLQNALPFFREFIHTVRPIISCDFDCHGSITDKTFFLCMGSSGTPWGLIVFVRTADIIHGVLMPVYQSPDQAVTYFDFLKNQNTSIQVAFCRFDNDRWEISEQTMPLSWPKSGMDLD